MLMSRDAIPTALVVAFVGLGCRANADPSADNECSPCAKCEPTAGVPSAEVNENDQSGMEPETTVASSLRASGRFAWTDGTTVFALNADHSFESGPVGMSGRTMQGCWRRVDERHERFYEVVGEMGWINGMSAPGDFRRMQFVLGPPHDRYEGPLLTGRPVYRSHFLMEEISAITRPQHDAAVRGCSSGRE